MDDSRRHAIEFIEKEIKTYTALSLFFSKNGTNEHPRMRKKQVKINPTFYRERLKEAQKLVYELKKPD